MKKIYAFLFLLYIPNLVLAKDCCEDHNGNSGTCSLEGTVVCNDGFVCKNIPCIITTPIPNIEKEPKEDKRKTIPKIYGCIDKNAKNYNKKATINDNSCIYYRYGCTNKEALNYDETAEKDDGSCKEKVYGCTDQNARNYDENANINNHKCEYILIKEVDEEIPYKVQIEKDKRKEIGEEEIIQKGITGRMKIKYEIILNGDGEEIGKKVLEKTILREAQNKIIKEGNNNSIYDRTIFLYAVAFICIIINFIQIKRDQNSFSILKEIIFYNHNKKNIWIKIVLLLLYFFLTLPVLIDLLLLIKQEIEKRI